MVPNVVTDGSPSSKPLERLTMILAIAVALVVGGATTAVVQQYSRTSVPTPKAQTTRPTLKTVTALGRLEPEGEVIKLSASTTNEGSRVEQLRVDIGDSVQSGQVIAILDSRDRLQADLEEAQARVIVAQAALARTKAGAKRGEIDAQRAEIARLEAQRQGELNAQSATIARLEAEVQNAQAEYNRYQSLYQQGAISASDRDGRQLTLQTSKRSLQEAKEVFNRIRSIRPPEIDQAKATLNQISEVRSVDVQADQAEVDRAIAAVKQAKTKLEQAYIRSPQDGSVLDIYTRPGEVVSSTDGIVEIGQTSQMYAVAEVYESDISKIKLGQIARITSSSLPGAVLQGRVDRIGLQIGRQDVVNEDPTANIDAKVVEVKIELDQASSAKVAGLTNLQVTVKVEV